MKLACIVVAITTICGCATTRDAPTAKPKPVEQDVLLASNFLDALFRPTVSGFQVIADADSEEAMGHIPLATRNKELRERLKLLRKPPNSVVRVNLRSAALPKPWGSGHYIYTFDTRSGNFDEVRPHEYGGDKADMWIRIDHWPNGTRLVSLSFTWIDDLKDNIFHLRKGERKFRFAIAIEPLTD